MIANKMAGISIGIVMKMPHECSPVSQTVALTDLEHTVQHILTLSGSLTSIRIPRLC